MIKTVKIKGKFIGKSHYFNQGEYYDIIVFYDKNEMSIYAGDKRITYASIGVFLNSWTNIEKI